MTSKLWDVMNDLEMTSGKVISAREIISAAVDALEKNEYERAETLMNASYEFLEYYLNEFDNKFKDAWQEVIVRPQMKDPLPTDYFGNDQPWTYTCGVGNTADYCNNAWNDFWEENYYPEEHNEDKIQFHIDPKGNEVPVKKWVLPVQQKIEEGIDDYYVQFPDDLLEAANLKEGDQVEWVDQGDGSYLLKKVN